MRQKGRDSEFSVLSCHPWPLLAAHMQLSRAHFALMAGLAMTVSDAEPRMESSLIDVPNDRCPKGQCMDDSLKRLFASASEPVDPSTLPQALGLASSPPRLLERSKSQ
ncbi:hypothetical protein MY3296_000465 [Beauveria thailandica]